MKKRNMMVMACCMTVLCGCVDFDDYGPELSGYSQTQSVPGAIVPTQTYYTEVKLAGEFAAKAIGGKLDKVLSAAEQVVSGKNYHLTIKLVDGSVYRVVVYKDLNYNYSLVNATVISRPPPRPVCDNGYRWSPMKQMCLIPRKTSPDGNEICMADDGYYDTETNTCKELFK